MNQFGKFAEKIGILVQGGTVNVGQIRLDSEMSRQELRNRKALLNNVRTAWVEGVLEKSLHEQIPIVLGLENRPNAVASPWNLDLINPDQSCQPLSAGTPVIDVFDQLGEGGTLLILGEPGSGKTITLLQLARELIVRAKVDIDRRIPVVLNLSSWAAEKQTIAEWIIEELNNKYDVPRKIGQQWVEKQELLLLLDGLDEIRDLEKRNACVKALNAFQQKQATEMVVCCREKDYEKLKDRLKLQSALVLQPLTTEQIHTYLEQFQSNLTVLKTLLIEDQTLQELAQAPLLLSIMVLAYQGIEFADISVSSINSNRKKQLFDDYINRIFQGSRLKAYHPNLQSQEKDHYSRPKATYWLVWMAKHVIDNSKSVFQIEEMPTTILDNLLGGFEIHSLDIGFALLVGMIRGIIFAIIWGIIFGVNIGLFGGLIWGGICTIRNLKNPDYSLVNYIVAIFPNYYLFYKYYLFYFKSPIVNLLIFGLTLGIALGMSFKVILLLVFGLFFGLKLGLIIGNKKTRSIFIWLRLGLEIFTPHLATFFLMFILMFIGRACELFFELNFELIYKLIRELFFGLGLGLILGIAFGFIFGLISFFANIFTRREFVLRLIIKMVMYFKGYMPWNYSKFLDWASDKLFLQKVGGGYIFIHRSLMEHFAEMENG